MASREAYIQKLRAELDRLDAELERLKAKAGSIRADARIEYERHLASLGRRRSAAEERLAALREASADAWQDMTAGLEVAWGSLRDAVTKASRRFGS